MDEKLFDYYKTKGLLNDFSGSQIEKFRYACKKAIVENPKLDFNELLIACNIYHSIIRDFPGCDLGDVNIPEQS